MTNRYFAADNIYGSEMDIGSANTWYVLAFNSRKARNQYVDGSRRRSRRAITCEQIRRYIQGTIKPYSGQRYWLQDCDAYDDIPGCIGGVVISDNSGYGLIEPLNK